MANTPLVAANVAQLVNNGSAAPATTYSIVTSDVTNGISIPQSLFAGSLSGGSYGQATFLPERLALVVTTTTPGTAFSVVVKATQPLTDVANEAPVFPSANAGDMTVNVNTNGTYYVGPFTSGRFLQPDGSLLINFSGILGVTTLWLLTLPYAAAGPRG